MTDSQPQFHSGDAGRKPRVLLVSPCDRFEEAEQPGVTHFSELSLRPFCSQLDLFNYRRSTFSSKLHLLRFHCPPFRDWDRRRVGRRLLEEALRKRYDCVIIFKGEEIPPAALMELKNCGGPPIIGWTADDPFQFPNLRQALPAYSIMAVWDSAYINKVRDAGVERVFLLPCFAVREAMSPADERSDPAPEYELTFAGTWSPDRETQLAPLLPLGLRVWGNDWGLRSSFPRERIGKALPYREMLNVFARSRLTINIHHPQGVNDANFRTFEAMGTGVALVDEPHKDTLEMFTPGKHFIPWRRKKDDIVTVVAGALKDREVLREIGKQSRELILSRHLIQHRWAEMFKMIDSVRGGI